MHMCIDICMRACMYPSIDRSKGIPGKNIKPLCGKPLLHWTVQICAFHFVTMSSQAWLQEKSKIIKSNTTKAN